MSGPYQGRDLSNCGVGRLRVAINCGVLSVKRSVSPKRPPKHQCFSTVSEKEIEESITNRIPINTKKKHNLEPQCLERMVSGKEH